MNLQWDFWHSVSSVEIKRRQGTRKNKIPRRWWRPWNVTGVKYVSSFYFFFFTARLFMYKVKMTKLVTLLVGISLSLGIFFFFSITKRIWRFSSLRKQTAFSVLFPTLKTNKNLISFSHDSLTPNNFEIIRNGAQQQRDVILGIELPIKDDGNKRDFINSRVVGEKRKKRARVLPFSVECRAKWRRLTTINLDRATFIMGHGTGWWCGPPPDPLIFSSTTTPALSSLSSVWVGQSTHTLPPAPPSSSSCVNTYKRGRGTQQRFSLCVLHNEHTHTHTQQQES